MKINWKKVWKVVKALGLLAGAIGALVLANKARKVIIAKVKKPNAFWIIPGDREHVNVIHKRTKKPEKIKLPEGVKPEKVKAVELDGNTVKVEVYHEKVDRRNVSSIDNSALDRLHTKS